MASFWPAELPADVECTDCGETFTLQQSYGWTYDDDGKPIDGMPKYDIPTSKRREYIVFCPCGRRLADILDPHWPGGASGGYVEDPPEERTG